MPYPSFRPYLAAALLLCAACASAPPPAPKPAAPAPVQVKAAEPQKFALLCSDKARAAVFDQIGVPSNERPVGVALAGQSVLVLFEPARLLRLTRQGDKVDVEMTVGDSDERWVAFDLDPVDGSIWVVSDRRLPLLHILPGWRRETVRLQKVEGEGGFGRVLAAEDALYLTPTSSDKQVWRVDRKGKVLDTYFPSPAKAPGGPGEVRDLEKFAGVSLLRDPAGHVMVHTEETGKILQADGKGGWSERPDLHWFDHAQGAASTVKGIDVGGKDERWFLAHGPGAIFFWKGRPVFLGPSAIGFGKGGHLSGAQVFYVPDPTGASAKLGEFYEVCKEDFIWGVASNADSYAAIGAKEVFFGDFADAPDLP